MKKIAITLAAIVVFSLATGLAYALIDQDPCPGNICSGTIPVGANTVNYYYTEHVQPGGIFKIRLDGGTYNTNNLVSHLLTDMPLFVDYGVYTDASYLPWEEVNYDCAAVGCTAYERSYPGSNIIGYTLNANIDQVMWVRLDPNLQPDQYAFNLLITQHGGGGQKLGLKLLVDAGYAPTNENEAEEITEIDLGLPCGDGINNDLNVVDGSYRYDCGDPNCDGQPANGGNCGAENTPLACSDGFDNDQDNNIDCLDPGCNGVTRTDGFMCQLPETDCSDGYDNDWDNKIDCADNTGSSYCWRNGVECPTTETSCTDGIDNDWDMTRKNNLYDTNPATGYDCLDYDCKDAPNCPLTTWGGEWDSANQATTGNWTCHDLADNDLDDPAKSNSVTSRDCADLDCLGVLKPGTNFRCFPYEFIPGLIQFCSDSLDNDGDGLIDCSDSDCKGTFDNCGPCPSVEDYRWDSCADGFNNDYTGGYDWADDDCYGEICNVGGAQVCLDNENTASVFACGDGFNNDGTGYTDCRDTKCTGYVNPLDPYAAACGVENTVAKCSDGFNNNNYGGIDCLDSGCWNVGDCADSWLTTGCISLDSYATYKWFASSGPTVKASNWRYVRENTKHRINIIGTSTYESLYLYIGDSSNPYPYSSDTCTLTGAEAHKMIKTTQYDQGIPYALKLEKNTAYATITNFNFELTCDVGAPTTLTYPIDLLASRPGTPPISEFGLQTFSMDVREDDPPSITEIEVGGLRSDGVVNVYYGNAISYRGVPSSDLSKICHCDFNIDGTAGSSDGGCTYTTTFGYTQDYTNYPITAKARDGSANNGDWMTPSQTININVRPKLASGGALTIDKAVPFYRSTETVDVEATFITGVGDTFTEDCQAIIYDYRTESPADFQTLSKSLDGNQATCSGSLGLSGLSDGMYMVMVYVTDSDGDTAISNKKAFYRCDGLAGDCAKADFDADGWTEGLTTDAYGNTTFCDECPGVVNSGLDSDADGIDDVCDALSVCGNDIREEGEECDGTDITGTCQDFGYYGGTLGCTGQCTFNESECFNDTEAPTTTYNYPVQLDGVWTNQYPSGFDVTLTALDNPEPPKNSGVNWTRYCTDNTGACTPVTDYSGVVPVTEDGTTFVKFHSADNAGNVEDVNDLEIKFDRIAPLTTSTFESTEWQKYDIEIALGCVDANPEDSSGCALTEMCIEEQGVGCNEVLYGGGTIIHSSEGIYEMFFHSTDAAGNEEDPSNIQILKLDKIAPLISDDYPFIDWINFDHTVVLTTSDGTGSGIDRVFYCTGGACNPAAGDPPSQTGPNTYEIDHTSEGDVIVRYQTWDLANNPSDIGWYNVKIDKTNPTAPVLDSLPEFTTSTEIELSWSASTDALSLFKDYDVFQSVDGGVTFQLIVPDFTGTSTVVPGTQAQNYQFFIRAYDNAGNYADSNTISTTIDTEEPSVIITSPPYDEKVYNTDSIEVRAEYANDFTVTCEAQTNSGPFVGMDGDGAVSGTATHTFPGLTDGTHSFTVDCVDEAGLHQTDTVIDVLVDTVAPTTASSGFDPADWENTPFTITLSCSDPAPASGCDVTLYCINYIDSGSPCEPTTPYPVSGIVHSAEGTYKIYYYSVDNAGNEEEVNVETLRLDLTDPEITDDYAYSGVWVNTPQIVTLDPSDAPSGVDFVMFCEDGTCDPTLGTILEAPYQLSYTADQDMLVGYKVWDNSGRTSSSKYFNVKIDQTPPLAPSIEELPIWTTEPEITITWTAALDAGDAPSGIDYYEVWRKSDGGSYIKVSNGLPPSQLSFADTGGIMTDITYYYKVIAYDVAGNSVWSNEVWTIVDTEAPTVEIVSPQGGEIYTVNSITVVADYANTFLVTCEAQVDSEPFVGMAGDGAISGTATADFSGLAEGLHSFTVICEDEAGNAHIDTEFDVRVDTIAPVTYDDYGFDGIWTNDEPVIALSAFDPEPASGLAWTRYCLTAGCDPVTGTDYTGPINNFPEGTTYARYASADIAGNVEDANEITVLYDYTPPVIDIALAGSGACDYWDQTWTDLVANSYYVLHGCGRISGVIDASVAGLDTYTITLKDSQSAIVATSTDAPLDFEFTTGEDSYQIVLEATDNAGNYEITQMIAYEDDDQDVQAFPADNGGAPDIFDACPTQVPSLDDNKNGCQDTTEEVSEETDWCIGTYSGSSADSIYPITGFHSFGVDYTAQNKLWHDLTSEMSTGTVFDYGLNVRVWDDGAKDRTECNLDPEQIITSLGHLLKETQKDKTKFHRFITDATGEVKVHEVYHLHKWSDGSDVHANMKYNPNKDESKLHIVYKNQIEHDNCEWQAKQDKDACKAACDRKDKVCNKACDDAYKDEKKACLEETHYQINEVIPGYNTLSLYDILRYIGFEAG